MWGVKTEGGAKNVLRRVTGMKTNLINSNIIISMKIKFKADYWIYNYPPPPPLHHYNHLMSVFHAGMDWTVWDTEDCIQAPCFDMVYMAGRPP